MLEKLTSSSSLFRSSPNPIVMMESRKSISFT